MTEKQRIAESVIESQTAFHDGVTGVLNGQGANVWPSLVGVFAIQANRLIISWFELQASGDQAK